MAQRRPRIALVADDAPNHVRMLYAIRRQHGWTQAELGAALGVSARTIRQWEHQHHDPYPNWMTAIRELCSEAEVQAEECSD